LSRRGSDQPIDLVSAGLCVRRYLSHLAHEGEEEHEDEDDDGVRTIYSRGQMERAIGDALKRAKVRGLADGGKLGIKFTAVAPPASPGLSGAKQYTAKYEPPVEAAFEDAPPFDPDDEPF
jgi:hypothetical protein